MGVIYRHRADLIITGSSGCTSSGTRSDKLHGYARIISAELWDKFNSIGRINGNVGGLIRASSFRYGRLQRIIIGKKRPFFPVIPVFFLLLETALKTIRYPHIIYVYVARIKVNRFELVLTHYIIILRITIN